MTKKSFTATILWDRFGVAISTICAIHCLFIPVFVALMPLISVPFYGEWVHPIFIALIAPTVYFAARRSHFDRSITLQLVAGLVLIILGWLIGHHLLGVWTEAGITLAGSALLIRGHWRNYIHHQRCTNHSHQHHPVVEPPAQEDGQKEIRSTKEETISV